MEPTFALTIRARRAVKDATTKANIDRLAAAAADSGFAVTDSRPDALSPFCDDITIFAGAWSGESLASECRRARQEGSHAVVAVDAIEGDSAAAFLELHNDEFQLLPAAAVALLIKREKRFIYPFPKADSTTTTCVLFDGGKQVLVIKRKHNPYKGCDSLPGGFLNVQLEDLPSCAARELKEECGIDISPSDLRLVDVRSAPGRDNRGHVVDHGYMYLVPDDRKAEVLAQLQAGDDAEAGSARTEDVSAVLARDMAFDHKDLLVAALKLV